MSDAALTLVVVATGGEGTRAELLETLAAPLAAGELELIEARAAWPNRRRAPVDPRIFRLDAEEGASVPRLRALGLRAARTRWAALSEQFCVPGPTWFDALREATRAARGVAIGGAVDRRGGDALGWALTLREFGRFLPGRAAGPVGDLPGVNVAYDLVWLRRHLGALPDEIYEFDLHRTLRASGARLWFAPGAVVFDLSRQRLTSACREQSRFGRLHAGRRAAERSRLARLARAAAAPSVPLVLLARSLGAARAAGRGRAALRAAPYLLLLHAAWAYGEGQGYLFGAGATESTWV